MLFHIMKDGVNIFVCGIDLIINVCTIMEHNWRIQVPHSLFLYLAINPQIYTRLQEYHQLISDENAIECDNLICSNFLCNDKSITNTLRIISKLIMV